MGWTDKFAVNSHQLETPKTQAFSSCFNKNMLRIPNVFQGTVGSTTNGAPAQVLTETAQRYESEKVQSEVRCPALRRLWCPGLFVAVFFLKAN